MTRELSAQRVFFLVGHKVQLRPDSSSVPLGTPFARASATITRIQLCPDPTFFSDPHDWHQGGPHWVNFWIKFDPFPDLDEHLKQMEIPYRYQQLQPLSPRMTVPQLMGYCEQRISIEQNNDRKDAYFQAMHYLKDENANSPLRSAFLLPTGRCFDLINLFLSWAIWMQQKAQEDREKGFPDVLISAYERQSQVYNEIYQSLLPKQHGNS